MKCEAGVAAVVGKRFFLGPAEATENCAETRATAEKTRGLVSSQFQGVFFVYIDTADFGELDEFAFDHLLREVDQNIENTEVAFLERHLE